MYIYYNLEATVARFEHFVKKYLRSRKYIVKSEDISIMKQYDSYYLR